MMCHEREFWQAVLPKIPASFHDVGDDIVSVFSEFRTYLRKSYMNIVTLEIQPLDRFFYTRVCSSAKKSFYLPEFCVICIDQIKIVITRSILEILPATLVVIRCKSNALFQRAHRLRRDDR